MLKIAFLTLIAVVALGVWALAQDPGMPDSAALGNFDCSPIYLDNAIFYHLWFKNDEDMVYFMLLCGINSHQGIIGPGAIYNYPLSSWDVIFDTTGFLSPDYPEYYFSRVLGFCNMSPHSDNPPLNTDSVWAHIATFRFLLWRDSLSPGDTIHPILIFNGIASCASPIIVIDQQSSDDAGDLPREFAITRISPNPFNAETTMHYALPEPSEVSLSIYDILGRKIEMLDMGYQNAGEHAITWDATGCNSGVYFARLIAGGRSHVGQMVLVK